MIEWHVVDAWTLERVREGTAFVTLGFIGGWAAPLFLFLAGVAIPFAGASHQRKALAAGVAQSRDTMRAAAWALQQRGWQVFFFAHLFRLHSFITNPWARGDSIFKPDILNILGLGMVATAWCWGRSAEPSRRYVWLLVPAAVAVLIGLLAGGWAWPDSLQPRLEAYIRPNGGWGQFSLFPWIAFVLVGGAVGVWIATPRAADAEPRFHAHLAAAGAVVTAAGLGGMLLPSPFDHSYFWTNSLSYFLIRAGGMTLAISGAWWWLARPNARPWGPIMLFGQTSLFVYWVHVELAYGLFSAAWKRSLTIPQAAIGYVAFCVLMYVAARWWARRTAAGPWIPEHLRA